MARVLVVDDQNIPRATVAAMLGEGGHEVTTEAGGAAGLERAREWLPDVIVLDVHMPEMDGFAVVERLKKDAATAAIPVVFLTGTSQTDDLIVRGLDLGAYDFLSKGCSSAELLARVGVMARIKRSNDELTAIARIADALIRSLDPAELTRRFLDQTTEVFRADASLLVLPGSVERPPLYTAVGIDADDPLAERLAETVSERFAGAADAEVCSATEISGPAGALLRRLGLRSLVYTSVQRDDHPPMLLVMMTKRENGFQRESDSALLHLLARQATMALDNALLHAQTQEQATKMAEQAEALGQAMSERSRFFASMSHEIRTPINAVIGYNQLLQEGTYGEMTEAQTTALGKVSRSATHLLELINDVLDISKIEAGKMEVSPERTPLAALIRDTITSVQLKAQEKGIEVRTEVPAELTIWTDPARLRQILLNLFSNAIKFTDEGSVTVSTVQTGGEEPAGDGRIQIRVQDTGTGISEEDQKRIFEEFEQAGSREHGGTGLGLAISRKVATVLGGELLVESELGNGATFIIDLPVEVKAVTSPA